MSVRFEALKRKMSRDLMLELVRFVLVGGASFVIDLGLLVFFQEYCGLGNLQYGVLISCATSYVIALVIHYVLSSVWVFEKGGEFKMRQHAVAGGLFILTNGAGLALTGLGMWIGVDIMCVPYVPVKLLVAGLVMAFNYLTQKCIVFQDRTA